MRALKDPIWGKDHQHIDCKIRVNEDEWAPFTVSAADKDPKMMAIFASLEAMGPDEYVPPVIVPTARDVNRAREKLLSAGFTFDGNVYQADIGSMVSIAMAAGVASEVAKAKRGDVRWHGGDDPFTWITSDNKRVEMTASDVIGLRQAAMLRRGEVINAARDIKDMDEIPPDFADHI